MATNLTVLLLRRFVSISLQTSVNKRKLTVAKLSLLAAVRMLFAFLQMVQNKFLPFDCAERCFSLFVKRFWIDIAVAGL